MQTTFQETPTALGLQLKRFTQEVYFDEAFGSDTISLNKVSCVADSAQAHSAKA